MTKYTEKIDGLSIYLLDKSICLIAEPKAKTEKHLHPNNLKLKLQTVCNLFDQQARRLICSGNGFPFFSYAFFGNLRDMNLIYI